jgi:putative ABC transport system permease protein
VLLTTIGGGIGLAVGVGVSARAGEILSFAGPRGAESVTAIVDMQTAFLAIGISAFIGIVFGLFPALKAAQLDPVEALRYE